MYKFRRKKKYRMGYNWFRHTLFLYKWKTWVVLQIIYAVLMKGRTEAASIALPTFFLLIFFYFRCVFLSTKSMSFISFIYYKKNLKNHKIYFNKILVFLCELRNHFLSYHFLSDTGLLFSVNDEKNVYKKIVNYSLWFGLFL